MNSTKATATQVSGCCRKCIMERVLPLERVGDRGLRRGA